MNLNALGANCRGTRVDYECSHYDTNSSTFIVSSSKPLVELS